MRAAGVGGRLSVGLLLIVWACSGTGLRAQSPPPPAGKAPQTTRPLGAAERRELLGSVDAILRFASTDSGLAIRGEVKRRLISRGEVTRYLEARFAEDEGARRLERSELVLKKFGLLPREFALRPFLLRLLTEQIAGFYDPKTKTVNLLDWVAPEEQRPVLAHELTHALQDQAVGLERWSDSGVHGVARTAAEQTAHLGTDELETARSAVAEGQAMLVYTDYALRGSHKTLLDSPEVLERLLAVDGTDAGGANSPVLAEAPRVLQESLLFPYTEGLAFEAALLRAGGTAQAFAGALARPPGSSYEVMTPAAYLAKRSVAMLRLPDWSAELAREGWAPYDVGVLGELDVRMLAETYDRSVDAKAMAAAWDGGVYYAAQRGRGKGSEPGSTVTVMGTGTLGLVYVSRWRDAEAAERFARMYEDELPRRYRSAVAEAGERPAGGSGDADVRAARYDTDEGKVVVAVEGRWVFVAEGFGAETAERLRRQVLAVNGMGSAGDGAMASAGWARLVMPRHTPGSGLAGVVGAANYTLLRRAPQTGAVETRR